MPTSSAPPRHLDWRPCGLPLPAAAGFILTYLGLDWVSFIYPMPGLDITPWNPQSALAVGLLLWRPGAWWLVWLTASCTDGLLAATPLPWGAALLSSAFLAISYAVTSAALTRWLGRPPEMGMRRHAVIFFLVVAGGALLSSVMHVIALFAFGMPLPGRVLAAIHRAWIGDTAGLLVTLPVLFALASSPRRSASLAMLSSLEWWSITLVAPAVAVAVFARPAEEQFKFFYLLFLPVVWSAARFGVVGAAWSAAWVQLLLLVAVQSATYRPLTVFELQMLMAVLAATGLLLGTTVDEREEAARSLRASLHLAAAGDMAAALAHELNQPLAAMSSYARASQLMASRLGRQDQELTQSLVEVTGKLVHQASRASDVVKRLRNFFRDRSTELHPTDLPALLAEVLRPQAERAHALDVRFDLSFEPSLPAILLDPVQFGMVARNLVANAIDAVSKEGAQAGRASVEVRVALDEGDMAMSVIDTGRGLAAQEVPGIFESRVSGKPGGMGVGLGISRSIVEAHGGRMWAEPGPGGRFFVRIPASLPVPNE